MCASESGSQPHLLRHLLAFSSKESQLKPPLPPLFSRPCQLLGRPGASKAFPFFLRFECHNSNITEVGVIVGLAWGYDGARRTPLPPSFPSGARYTISPGAVYVRTPGASPGKHTTAEARQEERAAG